jgi:hypothetical protein
MINKGKGNVKHRIGARIRINPLFSSLLVPVIPNTVFIHILKRTYICCELKDAKELLIKRGGDS